MASFMLWLPEAALLTLAICREDMGESSLPQILLKTLPLPDTTVDRLCHGTEGVSQASLVCARCPELLNTVRHLMRVSLI